MGTENLFSTPRENTLSGEQMLEGAIKRKQLQRENLKALTEARKLSESIEDFTATMESNEIETEEKNKKDSAMESAFYRNGTKNIIKEQLTMKPRLIKEGTEKVWNEVIGTIIYESYWLDEPVKESTVDQIEDSIGQVITYIENKCPDSKVPVKKYNKLLKNVNSIIESVVKEAVDRIVKEAEETNTAFNEFDLNSAEEEKLYTELGDLGKDEIVELIKGKVAQVIQDEKEKGKEKAEVFDEIDNAIKDNEEDQKDLEDGDVHDEEGNEIKPDEDSSEEGISTEESVVPSMEGSTVESLKIYFSKCKSNGSKLLKEANKNYSAGNYGVAKNKYEKAKDIFSDLKERLKDVEDTAGGNMVSWLLDLSIGLSPLITLCDSINTRGRTLFKYSKNDDDGDSYNTIKSRCISNLNICIKYCDKRIGECNTGLGNKKYKYSLESALKFDSTDNRYTSTEKYVSNILESRAPFDAFNDPSWGEFKACISLLCKKIKNILLMQNPDRYICAMTIIDDLNSRLSNVPEDIPGDVKEFVMTMVTIIYGAVPTDEIIISRMSSPWGSPDTKSGNPVVDYNSISWIDLLVNIRTNLASIKSYCESKCNMPPNIIPQETTQTCETTFESVITRKKNQELIRGIGGSLFEAMMIGNISETESVAMESVQKFSENEVEDAALIESLLQYTVFETLDTLGLYKFRAKDINGIKKDYMNIISEGKSPIYGDSDSQTMSNGKDKKGKKKIRINTRKMKLSNKY